MPHKADKSLPLVFVEARLDCQSSKTCLRCSGLTHFLDWRVGSSYNGSAVLVSAPSMYQVVML